MSFPSNQNSTDLLLKVNRLSVTKPRKDILQLFVSQPIGALRHADIELACKDIDRVTIYRTLQKFCERGIIHAVPGSDGAARYALCKSGCNEGHHHDDHVHFLCTGCGQTQCLDHVLIPPVPLPAGFRASKAEMVVTGTCLDCKPQQ